MEICVIFNEIYYNNLPNLSNEHNEIYFKTIFYDSYFYFLSVYGMIIVNSGILFDYNAIIKAWYFYRLLKIGWMVSSPLPVHVDTKQFVNVVFVVQN